MKLGILCVFGHTELCCSPVAAVSQSVLCMVGIVGAMDVAAAAVRREPLDAIACACAKQSRKLAHIISV